MDAIILAAGYATRMYPLTLTRAKALLEVAGRPMIEHELANIRPIRGLDRAIVVTNQRFADGFEEWAAGYRSQNAAPSVVILNDGSTDESSRLGAIGDMHLALSRCGVRGDVIAVAGDNLFSQSLEAFGEFCLGRDAPVVALYDVGNLDEIRKYNAVSVDGTGRITYFEEKPARPTSTRTAIALYYYPARVRPLIDQYLAEGNNPDQPGRLVQWLYPRTPFYAWDLPGTWFDVGSVETLNEASRVFGALRAGRA